MRDETLEERATLLKESLQKCIKINADVISTLGSFDRRVSSLDEAWKPLLDQTTAIREAEKKIDATIESVGVYQEQFDLMRQANAILVKGPGEDLKGYIDMMDQLRNISSFFNSKGNFNNCEEVTDNINNMLAMSYQKMEDGFQTQLLSISKPVEPGQLCEHLNESLEVADRETQTLYDPRSMALLNSLALQLSEVGRQQQCLNIYRTMALLNSLALQLSEAGRQQQCLNIYRETRSSVLEESLEKIGAKRLNKYDVQKMQWEDLVAKISDWIQMMKIAVKLLFAEERHVCEQIFKGIDIPKDRCFADVSANSVAMLLSFGEAISGIQRSPEKLFLLLDMYEVMQELHPEIEMTFEGKACDELQELMLSLRKRLAHYSYQTLHDVVEAVEKDGSKPLKSYGPGAIHPLTRYVVNYVKFLSDYQSMLEQILKEYETGGEGEAHLETVTKKILQALHSNLERKSKQYDDPALCHLFLMNNFQQVVKFVQKSELKSLLGDDWVQRRRKIIQLNANMYKRAAWKKILECFDTKALSPLEKNSDFQNSYQILKLRVKERFKLFTIQFEELIERQAEWEVADPDLRDSLRLSICEVLLPAYRSFISRFGRLFDKDNDLRKYIKFTSEDVEQRVGEIFNGKPSQ